MERVRWMELYRLASELGKAFPGGVLYSCAVIVGVFLWAAIHDRPVSWACEQAHWPKDLPFGRRLPSQSVMSRRLRSSAVQGLLQAMERVLRQRDEPDWVKAIDSKPLVVGAYSKDRDARWGKATKHSFAKGYKLHVIWDGRAAPEVWRIEPMNVHDSQAAVQLLPQLSGSGYLLGDGQYDSNRLYDLAGVHNYQLVAPRRQTAKGIGHHRHSPYRLRSIELQQQPFGQQLSRGRSDIERSFGGLTCFGGGLAPLPSWVRRRHRVRLWVQAKILINAVRVLHRRELAIA
jgi:hypothetical protein